MMEGVLFLNSCTHCAFRKGLNTPEAVLTAVAKRAPSALWSEITVRSFTASPSPATGSSSANALFLTLRYEMRATGETVLDPKANVRPMPSEADHSSPSGLDVADPLIGAVFGLFDGI